MDVVTAAINRQGDGNMTTSTTENETAPATAAAVEKPEVKKKARAGARKPHLAPAKAKSGKKATAAKQGTRASHKGASARQRTKTAQVLNMLKRPGGATLKALMKVTSWQAHSVRGFLSGTLGKKMNLTVASTKGEGGERIYSVKG